MVRRESRGGVRKELRIPLGGAEMAQVRFAVSPVYEAFMAVGVLREPGAHAVHLPWVRWARPLLGRVPEAALLGTFWRTVGKPAFLLPVPDVRMPSLAEELGQIRATSPERVRRFFDDRGGAGGRFHRELYDDPVGGVGRLADALERVFELLIAPHWARLVGVLEADIVHRAGILADGGVAAVFQGLHRDVEWTGEALIMREPRDRSKPMDRSKEVALAGRALVLSPSVFCWPHVWAASQPSNAGVLRYPARAIATLWETSRPAPDALSALLGRTRADLLVRLAAPAGTGELAAALAVTPGAVSQHLGVLRAAGLVATRREGRAVLHLRTERGDALLG